MQLQFPLFSQKTAKDLRKVNWLESKLISFG